MIHDTYYISPLYCISKLHVSFDWFRLRICTFVSNTFNEDCCAKFFWHEKPISKAKNKNIYIIIREYRRYLLDRHDQCSMWQNIVKKKISITFCFKSLEDKPFSWYVKGFEAQFLYKDILSSIQGLIFWPFDKQTNF